MRSEKKCGLTKFALLGISLIFSHSLNAQNTVVKTSDGYIKGVAENQSIVFKGVPYAQPPVGNLRFKAPQNHAPWTDTLLCDKFGSISAQYVGAQKKVIGSEDCLSLNIYQPANHPAGKMPVLVWIHGGGMTNGAGKGNNGHAFSDNDGIITITINYRLGAFGFTYLGDVNKAYATSGNNGLLDCIMALKWIKQNIIAFDGDPSKVTVMGQSAGAKLVSAIYVSPAAKGYYSQLIIESGGVQCIRDSSTAKSIRKRMLDSLSVNNASNLFGLSTEKIIEAEGKVISRQGTNYFGPVNDGLIITGDPYQYINEHGSPKVRVLIGTTKYESLLFMWGDKRLYRPDSIVLKGWFGDNFKQILAAYQMALTHNTPDSAAIKVLTQYMYQMHSYRFAAELAQDGNPVWKYRFDYNKNGGSATHGGELSYVWYMPEHAKQVDSLLALQVHSAWVSFIKGEDNIKIGDQLWPNYNTETRPVFVLDKSPYINNLKHVYNDPSFPSGCFLLK
ncbi:carboxylesterase/lipase family protein [Mucilaginibacter sp.]